MEQVLLGSKEIEEEFLELIYWLMIKKLGPMEISKQK